MSSPPRLSGSRLAGLLAAGLALAAAACGSGTGTGSGGPVASASGPPQTITLFAAASTAKVMGEEITEFEARNPGITVQGDYEGTQSLLTKLSADPAAADLFLSADARHMDQALAQHLVARPAVLAGNRLAIAIAPHNPGQITRVADLARPGLRIVLADTSVPAGAYAEQALHLVEKNGDAPAGFAATVLSHVVSRESDVEQVVAKAASGEVDAGIVYVTDALANHSISYLPLAARDQPPTVYEVAVTAQAPHGSAARAFLDFLLGTEGQHILRSAGFTGPPAAAPPTASPSP